MIAILLGLATPSYTTTTSIGGPVVTTSTPDGETDPADDTSGDTGQIPPKPTKP